MPGPAPAAGSILGSRQLNRSYLARQLLLERQTCDVTDALTHLVGMQSQAPKDPFIGLWTRLAGFTHERLDQLMLERSAVRHTVMRGTIHLLTADDVFALRPVMQRMLERRFHQSPTYAPRLAGLDLDDVLAAGRALLDDALPARQLGLRLAERWPGYPPDALAAAVTMQEPVVQVTPRGVWGKSMQPAWTTVEKWLGRPVDSHREPDAAILRYLRAFGPATVADIQAWSGLPGLREAVERLRPSLATYRDGRSRELFDVPDAPFPDPDTPAPIRFLPGFENALLSHADRTRIVADHHRKLLWKANGLVDPTFLADGYVAGSWKVTNEGTAATLAITPFAPLSASHRRELEDEGERLLAFLEAGASVRVVRVEEPVSR